MKKKLALLICAVLAVMLICMAFGTVTYAGTSTISYAFTGAHKADKGFAEGTITITAGASDGGTYHLYWADDSVALSGFDSIATVSVPASGSAVVKMGVQTAIPAQATKLIAYKGSGPTFDFRVERASAVYDIPAGKKLAKSDSDLLYSFASYSDLHIKSDSEKLYEGYQDKYPYDEEHLTAALNTAAERGVDFIVTTGDHINNQRNDPNGGNNDLYAEEWNTYLRILADSEYCGPIYEAIGNHELWNYDIESSYLNKDWRNGYNYFIQTTGLDSTKAAYNSGKAYYEITEPVTGDHFLFMALEGGFYTDRTEEFSIAQLNWLESKLKAYQNDGKNTFILEHANFDKWGAGDVLDHPVYDLPLKDTNSATVRLKKMLQTYKNAVLISGHTHFRFTLQNTFDSINFSDNNGTSMPMIHNSSVGAVRDILPGYTRYDDSSKELTEGYIVEVYSDATIFYAANLWNNSIISSCCYIIPQSTTPVAEPTESPTQAPTEAPTEPDYVLGDADDDGELSILDATAIQRKLAGLPTDRFNAAAADVDGDKEVSILDATSIQRKLAGLIHLFIREGGDGFNIAPTAAGTELDPPSTNYSTLRTQAKNVLDKYWLLASYDQYQGLKKAYRERAGLEELTAAYNSIRAAVKVFWPGDTVDVYFTNNQGWENICAYCYNGNGEYQTAWPGKTCTYVTKNDLGQEIYKVTVPIGRYNFIIFNDGKKDGAAQTINLALGITRNQGYYTEGRYMGKYKGYQYVYR